IKEFLSARILQISDKKPRPILIKQSIQASVTGSDHVRIAGVLLLLSHGFREKRTAKFRTRNNRSVAQQFIKSGGYVRIEGNGVRIVIPVFLDRGRNMHDERNSYHFRSQ